ncbi:rhodanese-like domain-containing protein [Fulvivirgaceae bacterium PWU4]|uniref:Rhodanese-like domain-containing protein n=1 Tax=Chryseosolibacter histidini TaxID=2782349 RepID=A0AAP2GH80_9BACT|nr:rhodanese-like domain-containing protein [Chryseosolibacter histidini]MBT1695769.1 rhodanese-like domain-containing protein [Chryseosolibacter histidini]
MKSIITFLLVVAATGCFAQSAVEDLSPAAFKSKMDSLSGEVLLDLRTSDEMARGVIPGADQLDYFRKDFESAVGKLDRNKTYFIYCAVGGRSRETADLMARLGFKHVYNLAEGFTAWKKQKLPISRAK